MDSLFGVHGVHVIALFLRYGIPIVLALVIIKFAYGTAYRAAVGKRKKREKNSDAIVTFIQDVQLLQKSVPSINTMPEAFDRWQIDIILWYNKVVDFLKENYNPRAVVKFEDTSNMVEKSFPLVHPDLNDKFNKIERHIANLKEILENPDVYLEKE